MLAGSGVLKITISSMEIGVPSNVRHVVHVTFDRFNGFLGLPVEFEPEVPGDLQVPGLNKLSSSYMHSYFLVLFLDNNGV